MIPIFPNFGTRRRILLLFLEKMLRLMPRPLRIRVTRFVTVAMVVLYFRRYFEDIIEMVSKRDTPA